MKAEDILQAHDLDILFEGRHKAYGAYDLRKHYEKRVRIALLLVFLIFSGLSIWGLMHKPEKKALFRVLDGHTVVNLPNPTEEKKPEPKKPEQPHRVTKPASTQSFTNRIQVVPNQIAVAKIRDLIDSVAIDNKNNLLPGTGPLLVKYPPGPPSSVPPVPDPPSTPDPSQPLEMAEKMPEFPGGEAALRRFLEKNLAMPGSVEENEIVTVKMRFIVGYDGKLRGFETIQDGGEECNKEVMRVLKKMPDWNPGRSKGNAVSVYYILPVSFVRQE